MVGGGPVTLENEYVFELPEPPAVEGAAKGLSTLSVIDPTQLMVLLL